MTNFGIIHNPDCMVDGAALDLIKKKTPLQLLLDKYGLRNFELNNKRIWKDIWVTQEDQERMLDYCNQMWVVVMDKPYEKTRFAANSIKEVEKKEDKKLTIADLEEQIKMLKLEQELEELKSRKKPTKKALSPKKKTWATK